MYSNYTPPVDYFDRSIVVNTTKLSCVRCQAFDVYISAMNGIPNTNH